MPKRLWIQLWMFRWMTFIASSFLMWPRVVTYLMRAVALAETLCIFSFRDIGLRPLMHRRRSLRLLGRKLGFRLNTGHFLRLKSVMLTTAYGPAPVCCTFPRRKCQRL